MFFASYSSLELSETEHNQWSFMISEGTKHVSYMIMKIFTYIVADDYLNPSKDTYRTKSHIYDNFIHTWELTH